MNKELILPPEPFTMQQLIDHLKLNIPVSDAGRTRVLAKYLRDRGYRRVRGRVDGETRWVWTTDPGIRIEKLKGLLEGK